MKIFYLLMGLLLATQVQAQESKKLYDEALARKLGADDYGMKQYIFVLLSTGTYEPKDSFERNRLFAGHMANIQKLSKEGKLLVAGPFGKNQNQYRGLFILNTPSKELAMEYLKDDPSISSGLFTVSLTPWYGSAALSEYLPFHEKVQKKSF